MTTPSNVTPAEFFRYFCKDPEATEYYQRAMGDATDDSVIEMYERRVEQLEEQVYFAQELLTALETGLRDAKSLKEYRKLFAATVENSNFEG